jgi:integrase
MAGKYRRGRSWYISWVEDGRQRHRSLGPVAEAEAEAARLAQEQCLTVCAAAGPPFVDWAERYAAWHAVEYPDSYYRVEQALRCHLIPFFGSVRIGAVSREMAEAYKRHRAELVAPGTVVKEWRTLRACIRHAVACGVIAVDPLEGMRGPRDLRSRPPRWYSTEELARIYREEANIRACTTPEDAQTHQRLRWSWQLLANTGMRRGEALHLRWADVGREEIGIRSDDGARTKSGRWRSVPISEGADEALDGLGRRDGAGYVVPQFSPPSLTRAFHRTLARADLDGSLHCLRHTFCSQLVRLGVPLRQVQVLAGHSSYATTERYAHLAPGDLRDTLAGLHL